MTSGSTAVLVDTNVPLYAVDPRDVMKQQRAIDVLDHLDAARTGIVGVQNLHEFLSVATKRLSPPLPVDDAVRIVLVTP
jgi:predicted nucleic acid-binding protein